MASKRKSTTPCMIPSKSSHLREELEQGPPVLERQAWGPEGGRNGLPGPGEGAGAYACGPCRFETRDLNLFLDHVYSGHPEFRADPSFLCVDCGAAAPKFEGLALHNARVHPSTVSTTLQLRRRDRRAVVEQNLVVEPDAGRDAEISITKTPIMRRLKGKSESKRITVSHPASEDSSSSSDAVSSSRPADRKENGCAVAVAHVTAVVHNGGTKAALPSALQIVNGSGVLPVLKSAPQVGQNRIFQSSPITVSSTSSKTLPKVMIPLSSIPTYSASMDLSPYLNTSFSKFSYPTKAELCYLTVVTKFPEEQIKIWFTAQRLKQGISWSPEEIEDARRKMFNTIIQTAPPGSQARRPPSGQHTFTVLPTAGIPHILQGSLVSQGGVIVTRPVVTNGFQVGAAPVTPAVTPKPQAPARPAALVGERAVGVVVGTLGTAGSNVIINGSRSIMAGATGIIGSFGATDGVRSGANAVIQASVINLSLGNSNHSNINSKINILNGKVSRAVIAHAAVSGKTGAGGDSSQSGGGGKTLQVIGTADTAKTVPGDRKPTSADVKTPAGGRADAAKVGDASKTLTATAAMPTVCAFSPALRTEAAIAASSPAASSPALRREAAAAHSPALRREAAAAHSPTLRREAASSPALRTETAASSPALRREAATACHSPAFHPSGAPGSRTPTAGLPDGGSSKAKKSQEQLSALKDSFLLHQFPDNEEVERLLSLTGLTVREVRKWFSDRRYHFRNLKGARSVPVGGKTGGTPGGGAGLGEVHAPLDLPEGNTGARTPQRASVPLSPPPSLTPTSPTTPSRRPPRPPSPDFTAIRYKEREPHQLRALEASLAQEADPSGEEVDRLRAETKMTRREIHGWFSEKRKKAAAERKREEAERAVRERDPTEAAREAEGKGGEAEDRQKEDGSGEPKVNPIKINLKMLKVTEANGKPESEASEAATVPPLPGASTSPTPPSSTTAKPPQSQSPRPLGAEQLHLLKQVYSRTQWPSAPQYDELIVGTGLPRPEVVRWFGDCRYVQKNGQLKWLDAYQGMALEEELQKASASSKTLQEHLEAQGGLEDPQVKELSLGSGLTEDLVRYWFSIRTSSTTTPTPSSTTTTTTTPSSTTTTTPSSSSSSTLPAPPPPAQADGVGPSSPGTTTTTTETQEPQGTAVSESSAPKGQGEERGEERTKEEERSSEPTPSKGTAPALR
ncbi:hypothetical protein NHX12_013516 [Muraenolepis orangiensis]|uniref:Homeobox domain-containing protein n=1 Tax=Muraenolepis orangiensis TaxID=630683 RepID=A0A9Q0I851_9TELE|nr:hypothetical protein NHX12_013516 [Muraenolepis orangiensis]